ncbi:hypothetical protein BDY19DRAFT_997091 [Irpex rosettiformis]|uniref:Uncharacterized protein n=1 Tax=Irpex rosettiformis TaxID=378272 RepID=A0ACB8TT34_9APHY|nr:hypothetical protein BDY19DRAFT_997091 [Irpex rosettiformis]
MLGLPGLSGGRWFLSTVSQVLSLCHRAAVSRSFCISDSRFVHIVNPAFQQYPLVLIVADKDATAELKVKIVKYFKSIERVQEEVGAMHARLSVEA